MDCASVTLKSIVMDCATSLGGIKKIWLTQYKNIKSTEVITEEGDDFDKVKVSLAESAEWHPYEFRKETGSLTSTLTVDETAGVNYVQNELSLVFTKMETLKRTEIAALSVGQVAAVVLDSNGKYWFLGKDDYVSASAGTGVTGTAKGDQNAYTLTLSTASESYPYELDATSIATLPA